MSASILGPNGHPMVELGGDRAWLTRSIGEFVCSFQWIHRVDIDPDGPHPCMCIFMGKRAMDVVPYVIPQRNAWAFADRDGNPTAHAMGAAFKAAIAMGTFPARDTVHKLVDIIVEGIPDLIKMPSEQPHDLHVARVLLGIEASAAINGRTIRQEVL